MENRITEGNLIWEMLAAFPELEPLYQETIEGWIAADSRLRSDANSLPE